MLLVLLPIPVAGELGQDTKTVLAITQRGLGELARRNILKTDQHSRRVAKTDRHGLGLYVDGAAVQAQVPGLAHGCVQSLVQNSLHARTLRLQGLGVKPRLDARSQKLSRCSGSPHAHGRGVHVDDTTILMDRQAQWCPLHQLLVLVLALTQVLFGHLAVSDISPHAPITLELPVGIHNRHSTYRDPHPAAIACGALHFKFVEGLAGRQRGAVAGPLGFANTRMGQFPAGLPHDIRGLNPPRRRQTLAHMHKA